MEPGLIFGLTLAFSWIMYIWEEYLGWRQYRKYVETEKLPAEYEKLMDYENFTKSRLYKIDRARFSFVSSAYHQLLNTVTLVIGVLPWLWNYAGELIAGYGYSDELIQGTVFLMIAMFISTLMDLPWTVYDTFVIEQRHGFNKQTVPFFIKDTIKSIALSLVLMVPIVNGVVAIVKWGGDYFFVYVWVFMTVISLLLMTIYPDFIAPLFDKYTPLPDGELKEKIEALAARLDYPLKKLFVVEGSKRSAHSNAYLYGFWKNKRIVLFDTLLLNWEGKEEKDKAKGMNDDEVVAVIGHELGHWSLYHTVSNMAISLTNQFLVLFVFGFLYKREDVYEAFGFYNGQPTLIGLLIIFTFIFAPYNEVLSFCMTALTRRMEFAADAFSAKLGYATLLCSGLIKLGKDNLTFPLDDPWYSWWHHDHPPVPERIEALRKLE